MKKLARTFLLMVWFAGVVQPFVAAEAPAYPQYVGHVNDFAEVISRDEEAKIITLARAVEQSTTAEIAVVTLPTIAPLDIDLYSVKLFERWGVGKKGKDNGVLIILAMKERKWRIETGYGLEGALPDVLCSEIGRNVMVPYFKQGQFGKGLLAGTMSVAERIGREYNVDLEKVLAETGYHEVVPRSSQGRSIVSTIFTLLLFILIFGMRMGLFGFLLFGRPGYWSTGGHTGSGGFGGGFGGFGGGMSGGGGASGGW